MSGHANTSLMAIAAVPFHPADQPPQAACPTCIKDHEDDSPKGLYGLRGVDEGQYDAIIPTEWFQCPPMKLDTSVPGMGAVRVRTRVTTRRASKAHQLRSFNTLLCRTTLERRNVIGRKQRTSCAPLRKPVHKNVKRDARFRQMPYS